MPYSLTFQERDGYLRVEGRGDRTTGDPVKNGRAIVDRVAMKCREAGYTRIMLVSHLTGAYPPFANFQVVTALEQLGIPKEWKMAYVNLDPKSHKAVLFSETMAVKKGFQARVFDNEQEACNWLNS
ncbi:hypothetical protein [Sedimenticola selenatireducens]|uniref:STAS/SEC14 domain-containing protein n=1 Tax=Sedimenticola selenatireducens TaxID=191960 RepID=A0A2N6CWQ3_9GAMM|nr:hypothetical protein [Sedimenticola selenatireducens]PLX61714.1 MAG: hypothetical protein C0630_09230 [Sedimenticola selenatireducens]